MLIGEYKIYRHRLKVECLVDSEELPEKLAPSSKSNLRKTRELIEGKTF